MNFAQMHSDFLESGQDESGPCQDIAAALLEEKTIRGHGRRQHGLNGKDADLNAERIARAAIEKATQ